MTETDWVSVGTLAVAVDCHIMYIVIILFHVRRMIYNLSKSSPTTFFAQILGVSKGIQRQEFGGPYYTVFVKTLVQGATVLVWSSDSTEDYKSSAKYWHAEALIGAGRHPQALTAAREAEQFFKQMVVKDSGGEEICRIRFGQFGCILKLKGKKKGKQYSIM